MTETTLSQWIVAGVTVVAVAAGGYIAWTQPTFTGACR